MAIGTITVEIFDRSWTSLGTISSAFLPRGNFLRNDVGEGGFLFPLYDTPALNLVQYNRIAVVTVEESGSVEAVVAAFHIHSIAPQRSSSGSYDGYIMEVSGPGILAELQWDNIGYTTISDGSQGPTNIWVSSLLAFAQESWSVFVMGSPTTAANAYLQAAGESVWDALLECSAQNGRSVAYAPYFASQTTGSKGREILFIFTPTAGNSVLDWDPLNLVKSGANPANDECTVLDIKPIEDTHEIATRVTIYGAGIGADVLTIADAQGNVTVPTGFSVDWTNSVITNTTLEAVSDQPIVHRLHQVASIKPEDLEDATAVETAAVQLFWAGIAFLRDRTTERRQFYEVTFIGQPGYNYTVGQLVNLVYSETSPIDAAGASNTTSVINVNDDFVVHEISMQVPNSGKHKGLRVVTMILGAEVSSEVYVRPLPNDGDVVVQKLKEHDEVLRHATARYTPTTPGGDGTYATADAPYLVLSSTTNLTNERQFVAGAGLAATDGGANSTYTVNVVAADTSLTINANDMQVRLASPSGLQVSSGLQIADTVAGAGLTISSKVMAVGAGDGIDVAADSIAVDVTDIIGNGLVEVATNNIALGTPGNLTATSTNAVTTTSHTHAIDSTIARSAITITAGAGLTGGGDLSANRTINVATADTSMTINADSIQVRLAATSGLTVSTGLMIDDSIAGAGLAISSKVLAVGGGDGIDVSADSISVDVTDIIGNGLVEAATNNIALGTPSQLTAATTNTVTTTSHTHAITTTNNGLASTIVATNSSGNVRFGAGSGTAQRRVHIVGTDGAVASFPSAALTGTESLIVENAGDNSSMAIVAATDAISSLKFVESGATEITAHIFAKHDTGTLVFSANGAGEKMYLTNGLRVGPSLSDLGAGWINVSGGVAKSGTTYTNPDYVLEHYFTGDIVEFLKNPGANKYKGLVPLVELKNFLKARRHLPNRWNSADLFDWADMAQMWCEELAIYITQLHDRVILLEESQ